MSSQKEKSIYAVVKQYADAWTANDWVAIADCYHDDIVFHYFGQSPLSGTHRGKAACFETLKQVRKKTHRKLIAIKDVLVGDHFGLIVATEQFEKGGVSKAFQRMLRYRVQNNKLIECWIYDEDQRLVDEHFA